MKLTILFLSSAIAANAAGPGGTLAVINMPGWTWDGGAQSYIDGETTSGPNPALGGVLESNQPIATLEVIKPSGSYGFALRAPLTIPEPSSILLTALAGGFLILRRKRS